MGDVSPWTIATLAFWIIGAPLLAVYVGGRLRDAREAALMDSSDPSLDLGQPLNRMRLQKMIDSFGLHGSVNVRDGRVLPCPNQEGRRELATLLMSGFSTGLSSNGNVNMMLLVHKDGAIVPTGVCLDDLRIASIALEDQGSSYADGLRDGVKATKLAKELARDPR